jgi:RAB protein geranylgeranyltransferase component A
VRKLLNRAPDAWAGAQAGSHMDQDSRSRMISLRISIKEYEALQALYPAYGARSISDFARLAMKRVLGSSFASEDALLLRLNDLDERVSLIEARFNVAQKAAAGGE